MLSFLRQALKPFSKYLGGLSFNEIGNTTDIAYGNKTPLQIKSSKKSKEQSHKMPALKKDSQILTGREKRRPPEFSWILNHKDQVDHNESIFCNNWLRMYDDDDFKFQHCDESPSSDSQAFQSYD